MTKRNILAGILVFVTLLAYACSCEVQSKPSKPLTQEERLRVMEDTLLTEFRFTTHRNADDFVKFAEAIDKLRKAYAKDELPVRQEK